MFFPDSCMLIFCPLFIALCVIEVCVSAFPIQPLDVSLLAAVDYSDDLHSDIIIAARYV